MVIPFGFTPEWIRAYLSDNREVMDRYPQGKELAHCRIRERVLTIPVEGGAGVLKRRGADPVLSEHGKWRREHLGAWQAAYGRTPYYAHLMPAIKAVYDDSQGLTLQQFNEKLLKVALEWIDAEAIRAENNTENNTGNNSRNNTLAEVREETRRLLAPDLSIFDAIFRLGKRTSFGI